MNPQLQQSIEFIKQQIQIEPGIAIILGSGLGSFADELADKIKIPTETIPHFPKSTVEGHFGYLVFGTWKGIPLIAVQGRTHFYEGYPIEKVTYVVRIIANLGVKTLIVTNASGGVNPDLKPGDLMLITDMSNPYTQKYFDLIESIAIENQIELKRGVLYVSTGPSYETAAEVKMIGKLGGDSASMSTVPEVIVANQENLNVIGISCITNHATGISPSPLSHEEVTETAKLVQKKFLSLLSGIIERLG
jgi:purine-nucleoside phosphorylase